MTRRHFAAAFGFAVLARPPRSRKSQALSYKFQAIAAERMPHTLTIRSSDPGLAASFARGGIFELREYASGTLFVHFDSLHARDRAWTEFNVSRDRAWAEFNVAPDRASRDAPRRIALYRPIPA